MAKTPNLTAPRSENLPIKKENPDMSDAESNFEERRQKVISEVRKYTQITFDKLHLASRSQTQALLEGTHYITEKDIDEWEEYVNGTMKEQLHSAHALYDQFMDPLLEALHDKAISERVVSKLFAEFSSESIDYKDKEQYVQSVFPKRLAEWRRVKKERDDLVKAKDIRSLKNTGITNFEKLIDPLAFADLGWKERKKLVEEVTAAYHARENGTEHLMPGIQAELEGFKKEGILHASKISTWMKRIFVKNATQKEIEAFMKNVVRPYADRWRETRKDFDHLHKKMGKNIPRGFNPVSVSAFLQKEYKQRTSYCDLLRLRLENVQEQDKKLASVKLRIRYNLDSKDWEGAEEDLTTAMKEWPDNLELQSMKTYLKCHRPEEETSKEKKESPDPNILLQNLRNMLSSIQGELHPMYVQAAKEGPAVFNRFLQISYNRVWVHENGYLDPAREIENAQDEFNQAMTEQYMKHGHSKGIEHNIVDGDTAAEEAIRYKTNKPQMLYVGNLGRSAVMEAVKDNANNEDFGYGTSLVPKNTHYAIQARIVKNLHNPMKNALRDLDRMGYKFTSSGSLMHKNGTPAFSNN